MAKNTPIWFNFFKRYFKGATLDNTALTLTYSREVAVPGSANATGTAGDIAYDATHIYICIATNTWVRATLATW